MKITAIFLVIISIFAFSCTSESEKELELLQVWLDENNIDAEPTSSGLYYIETKEGTGEFPLYGNIVAVDYEGRFLDGIVFDTSYDGDPLSFMVGFGNVIQGWDEGIMYMKNRGKATLIIPSNLAYGKEGNSKIPPYSTLIFDIELLSVFKK